MARTHGSAKHGPALCPTWKPVLDPRQAEVVRLRVFWGATMEHIGEVLGVSTSTVERDWRFARRWLAIRLEPTDFEKS